MLTRISSFRQVSFMLACAAVMTLAAAMAFAQQQTSGSESQPKPAADQVLSDMLQDMEPTPAETRPASDPGTVAPGEAGEPAAGREAPRREAVIGDVSAADVQGVAPGLAPQPLLREGEFVVNRTGRLVYSGQSSLPLFAFAADSRANPEPPMAMMPCQLLEAMEKMLAENAGQSPQFTVTGQVFVYHGRNYLLPTLMRPVVDRGNLQP